MFYTGLHQLSPIGYLPMQKQLKHLFTMMYESKPYKSRTSGSSGVFLLSVCGLENMRGTYSGHAVVDLMRS